MIGVLVIRLKNCSKVILVGRPFQSELGGVRGVVYVYRYEAVTSEWKQEAKLEGGIISSGDEFGFSVAISGETIVIGAIIFRTQRRFSLCLSI